MTPLHGDYSHLGMIFLGTYFSSPFHYDLWYRPATELDPEPNVIARYSDYGPCYSDGLAFSWQGLGACSLKEARIRAENMGLDVCREKYVVLAGGPVDEDSDRT